MHSMNKFMIKSQNIFNNYLITLLHRINEREVINIIFNNKIDKRFKRYIRN